MAKVVGWLTVGLSIALICFWAFWGIVENFHEGWFYESWLKNIGLMLAQYLSPMLTFIGITLVAIYWPRVGSSLYVLIAVFAMWFFRGPPSGIYLITTPLVLFALLFWFGRPHPRNVAAMLIVGLPLLTLIICGAYPAWRVAHRINDGNLATRSVQGNGVALMWAADGPGWPRQGMRWDEAKERCQYLAEDGTTLANTPQNIWRLPSVDEVVRSMSLHGENSQGLWDAQKAQASYQTRPDKETPLWNVQSQVIYWWTATEVDEAHAYMIVYDGKVWPRAKQFGPAYLGFRCVKPLSAE